MRRAPPATPRMRPEVRPRKLTRRSASPRGNVFKMMASVSRAGIRCRRADAASNACKLSEPHAHAELFYLSYAVARRNYFRRKTGCAVKILWCVILLSRHAGYRERRALFTCGSVPLTLCSAWLQREVECFSFTVARALLSTAPGDLLATIFC